MKTFLVRDEFVPDQYHLYDQDPTTRRIYYRCPLPLEVLEGALPDSQLEAIKACFIRGPHYIDHIMEITEGPVLDSLAADGQRSEERAGAGCEDDDDDDRPMPLTWRNLPAITAAIRHIAAIPDIPAPMPIGRRCRKLDGEAWE